MCWSFLPSTVDCNLNKNTIEELDRDHFSQALTDSIMYFMPKEGDLEHLRQFHAYGVSASKINIVLLRSPCLISMNTCGAVSKLRLVHFVRSRAAHS